MLYILGFVLSPCCRNPLSMSCSSPQFLCSRFSSDCVSAADCFPGSACYPAHSPVADPQSNHHDTDLLLDSPVASFFLRFASRLLLSRPGVLFLVCYHAWLPEQATSRPWWRHRCCQYLSCLKGIFSTTDWSHLAVFSVICICIQQLVPWILVLTGRQILILFHALWCHTVAQGICMQ